MDQDVRDALALSELAMDRQKKIVGYVKEVKEKQNEYYKKHGKWYEKLWANFIS